MGLWNVIYQYKKFFIRINDEAERRMIDMENIKDQVPTLNKLNEMRTHGVPVIGYIEDNYEAILNEINYLLTKESK